MEKLINWLQNSFSPKMNKVNNNIWVTTIKDSIMQTLPFIFLGSVFCMFTILADYIPWMSNFWTPYAWTMEKFQCLLHF